jgi:hypothetical protein
MPTSITSSGITFDDATTQTTSATKAGGIGTAQLADSSVTAAKLANPQYTGFRNRLINGDFRVAQRGISFTSTSGANNDDTYNLDRWYVLSDGNDAVDITRTTTEVPTNGYSAIALDVETVNKKFGIAQIIEQQNCIGLIGGDVTLTFKAKVSSTTKLENVKAAIVAWSGTADTVTSDIISAWGVEGTNPTLIASAAYENTPANLNITTSYATYTVTANVDTASTKNIIVFIWSDVTDTTLGDFLYITDVQLENGTVATPFEARPIGTELALCQRYYEIGGAASFVVVTNVSGRYPSRGFMVTKRVSPPIFTATPTGGTGATYVVDSTGWYQTTNHSTDAGASWTASAEL